MFFVSDNDGGGEREKRHGAFFLLLHRPFCEIDIIFITYTFCMFMLFACLSICIFQTLDQYGCGLVALSNVSCNLYFP